MAIQIDTREREVVLVEDAHVRPVMGLDILEKLRTGRGVWHAEGIGRDELEEGREGTEMRGLLFWVNLARKDKGVEPSARILQPHDVPVRHDGDAVVRALVGEGSPVELGTP